MEHDGTLFSPLAHQYHAAGIFPILSVKNGKDTSSISENISSLLKKSRSKVNSGFSALELAEPDLAEGLIIGSNEIKVIARWDGIEGRALDPIDVLLIHEGVMDHLYKNEVWEDSDAVKLYQFAPAVVRCSGRGRRSRHLHNAMPFLEFTEVSENTYQELNKPNLVKAMLGSSGNVKEVNEKREGSVS